MAVAREVLAARIASQRNPRRPQLLFGLRETLKAQTKPGVEWVDREFKNAGKDAEIDLRMADL